MKPDRVVVNIGHYLMENGVRPYGRRRSWGFKISDRMFYPSKIEPNIFGYDQRGTAMLYSEAKRIAQIEAAAQNVDNIELYSWTEELC